MKHVGGDIEVNRLYGSLFPVAAHDGQKINDPADQVGHPRRPGKEKKQTKGQDQQTGNQDFSQPSPGFGFWFLGRDFPPACPGGGGAAGFGAGRVGTAPGFFKAAFPCLARAGLGREFAFAVSGDGVGTNRAVRPACSAGEPVWSLFPRRCFGPGQRKTGDSFHDFFRGSVFGNPGQKKDNFFSVRLFLNRFKDNLSLIGVILIPSQKSMGAVYAVMVIRVRSNNGFYQIKSNGFPIKRALHGKAKGASSQQAGRGIFLPAIHRPGEPALAADTRAPEVFIGCLPYRPGGMKKGDGFT